MVELGTWPEGLHDAYTATIPMVEGDATPLGQHPLTCRALPLGVRAQRGTVRSNCFIQSLFLILTSLRSAIILTMWSIRVPLANFGAIQSLFLMVHVSQILHVVWSQFRHLRRYLAYRPGAIDLVLCMLCVEDGCPGFVLCVCIHRRLLNS